MWQQPNHIKMYRAVTAKVGLWLHSNWAQQTLTAPAQYVREQEVNKIWLLLHELCVSTSHSCLQHQQHQITKLCLIIIKKKSATFRGKKYHKTQKKTSLVTSLTRLSPAVVLHVCKLTHTWTMDLNLEQWAVRNLNCKSILAHFPSQPSLHMTTYVWCYDNKYI